MNNQGIFESGRVGYYLVGLVFLSALGFYPTYFSKVFRTGSYSMMTHIHVIIMIIWLLIVIVQPYLIKNRKVVLHKKIGRLSYAVVPLVVITALCLAISRIGTNPYFDEGFLFFMPLKDCFIITVCFGLALYHKNNPSLHARYMICSSLPLIEPPLVRSILFFGPDLPSPYWAFGLGFLTIDLLLLALIIKGSSLSELRKPFVLVLIFYALLQTFAMYGTEHEQWSKLTISVKDFYLTNK